MAKHDFTPDKNCKFNEVMFEEVKQCLGGSHSQHNCYLLDEAADWVEENLDPDDVFSEVQLAAWAADNGYTKA